MSLTNKYVNEHGMPIPFTAKERRRLAQDEADDAARQQGIRPNVDPHARQDFDDCTESKYFTHRFVAEKGRRCEFCGRHYKDCVVTK